MRSVHRGRGKRASEFRACRENCESRTNLSEIWLLFSPLLHFAPALVYIRFPVFFSRAIRLPFSRSLSPLPCTQFSLVSSFLPSSVFFASVTIVVGCRSVDDGRSVRACARQVSLLAVGSRSDERSRGHRARPPFTTVSFVLSFSLSPSLPRLLSPPYPTPPHIPPVYPAHTRHT